MIYMIYIRRVELCLEGNNSEPTKQPLSLPITAIFYLQRTSLLVLPYTLKSSDKQYFWHQTDVTGGIPHTWALLMRGHAQWAVHACFATLPVNNAPSSLNRKEFATQVETKLLGTELVDKLEWNVNKSPWNPKQTYQKEEKKIPLEAFLPSHWQTILKHLNRMSPPCKFK